MKALTYYQRNKARIILDLCGGSGAWSRPYQDAGYDVRLITLPVHDVKSYRPPEHAHGVLAAPPCDHLASSGARWWKAKGSLPLHEALSVVFSCLEIIRQVKPIFWCLENPVGRLVRYLGKPRLYFHPYFYGDPYTKKTCLWGNFIAPLKTSVLPTEGSKIHRLPPTSDRQALRSITPPGFARAFFGANQ